MKIEGRVGEVLSARGGDEQLRLGSYADAIVSELQGRYFEMALRGRIYHTWGTEMFFAPRDRGQDPRHVDLIWPVWNLLDMTPEGRGVKWGPKLRY